VLPARRQNLLFSATFSDEIRRLADGLLSDPATVQVTPRNAVTDLARQLVITVDRERKRALLTSLVRSGRIDQALVFTRTKHGASRLAEQLIRDGIAAAPIHGNRSQPQRVRALNDFKAGRVSILVATDIAARGIDIDALPHVINFELPMVAEDYVHRIGRTGRAGVDGDAISLVCVDELPLLRDIERLLRRPIEKEVVPGFEPDPSIRPEPIGRRVDRGRPVPLRGMPQRGVAQRGHVPARAMPQRSIGRRGPVRPGVNSQPGHLVQRAHVPPYGSGPQHGHGHATPRGTGYRPVGMPDRRPGGQPVALPGERLSGRVNRTPDRGH
jgi:ATP-dependent RNA helicase RhlE